MRRDDGDRQTERETARMSTVSPGVLRFVYTPIWVIQLSGTSDVESMTRAVDPV